MSIKAKEYDKYNIAENNYLKREIVLLLNEISFDILSVLKRDRANTDAPNSYILVSNQNQTA
jgi:hypothetical protein